MARLPVLDAVHKRYLSPNDEFNLAWFIYDVDRAGGALDWYDRNCPPPNLVAINRDNGHAHLFYGLEVPVWRQFGARDKAYRFAASVDVALTKALEADPGYGKLLAKNPLRSDAWEILAFQRYAYDLPWLSDYLDLEPYLDQRRNLPAVGLGRNCTLFEYVRRWAYRNIRRDGWLSADLWRWAVEGTACAYNTEEFPNPLPYPEVRATAKSVAKWTWANMSPAGFRAWGDARRAKSLASRREKANDTAERIHAAQREHPEASVRELAALLNIPKSTIARLRTATI